MTDIQTLELLMDEFDITPPADSASIAINTVSGNKLTLATSPGGTKNQWVGSVIEITSGASKDLRAIVTANDGTLITFGTPFAGNTYPLVGDTVKLYGGPLGKARLYTFEPWGFKRDVEAGILYFVTGNIIGGKIGYRGFSGGDDTGAAARENQFDVQVTAETPDVVGLPTEADAYRIAVELPTLKEQIVFFMHKFRFDEKKRITSSPKLNFVYGFIQRIGGRQTRCAILDMTLRIL